MCIIASRRSAVIIKKRRPAVAVEGVSTRASDAQPYLHERCATPARRARASAQVPAFASGRLAARTLARAQAGRVAKAVNRQPADGPEAAAPHKTQAAATRPAAASLALPFRRARPDLPARAPRLCHPRALPADDAWLIQPH